MARLLLLASLAPFALFACSARTAIPGAALGDAARDEDASIDGADVGDGAIDSPRSDGTSVWSIECGPTDGPMDVIVIAPTAIECSARTTHPVTYFRIELFDRPKLGAPATLSGLGGSSSGSFGVAQSCFPAKCADLPAATITLTEVTSTRMSGTYELTTADGVKHVGAFDAPFCGSFLGCG